MNQVIACIHQRRSVRAFEPHPVPDEPRQALLHLARYTFPIGMLCLGYASQQQRERLLTTRCDARYIAFRDHYRQLNADETNAVFADEDARVFSRRERSEEAGSIGQVMYQQNILRCSARRCGARCERC